LSARLTGVRIVLGSRFVSIAPDPLPVQCQRDTCQVGEEGREDADLIIHQFGRGAHVQRLGLAEIARMKIESPRRIHLADVNFPRGKFVNIKKLRTRKMA